jgi:flagellar biosynthesis anti-sigma factor FlgM
MIVNNNPTPDSLYNVDKAKSSSPTGAPAAAPKLASTGSTEGNDSISLSNSPDLVQQALASSSPARMARVQELKALVQNNQYQPDAQEVSSALIDAHLAGA